jgi:hypothetical protein
MPRPLPHLPLSTQLIGVDGGASGVRAHEVELMENRGQRVLSARLAPSAREWPSTPGYRTPAERGFESAELLGPLDALELDQAWRRIETTAHCILDIARARGAARVLVGVAMPGVKTPDGRGIAFARHGPRNLDFAEKLEHLLRSEGLELAAPIRRLESDGWCAGLGEEYAEDGLLRGADCAYYLGGGTGLAEALKLNGELVPLETLEAWFPRAWKLREPLDERSYDDVLSTRGLNALYEGLGGVSGFPEQAAASDARAQRLFELTGERLAILVVERVCALRARGPDTPEYPGPHEIARVVVGQRLGQLLGDERTRAWFERAYCSFAGTLLRERRLDGVNWTTRISTLRAAPAIGAAASALLEARASG